MSDPILLALIRQLLRQGVLSDMDVQAMAADLEREGHADEAHSVNVAFIEACALDALSPEPRWGKPLHGALTIEALDGGNG